MTEEEWRGCENPFEMIQFLDGKASKRKFAFFAARILEGCSHLLDDEQSRNAILALESIAEGREIYNLRLHHAPDNHFLIIGKTPGKMGWGIAVNSSLEGASNTAYACYELIADVHSPKVAKIFRKNRKTDQLDPVYSLLDDIFGNPFRPTPLDPSWQTSTVVTLAQQIYDSRDFSTMPILADALQDAGCDNAAVLDHCRDAKGVHVRGCWLVDLILDRK